VTSTSTLSGASAGNYTLTQPSGLKGTITAKVVTLTGVAVTSKAYDGTTSAKITGTLSGMLPNEAVTLVGTGSFASKNAGANQGVTSTSTLSGAAAGNYTLTQPSGLKGTITAKGLSITAPTIASKAYDGKTAAGSVTVGSLSGLLGSETLIVSGTAAAYSSFAVGTYPNVVVTYSLANGNSGGLASNYSLAAGTATGTIVQKKRRVMFGKVGGMDADSLVNSTAIEIGEPKEVGSDLVSLRFLGLNANGQI
jgi:hypothetical protein